MKIDPLAIMMNGSYDYGDDDDGLIGMAYNGFVNSSRTLNYDDNQMQCMVE